MKCECVSVVIPPSPYLTIDSSVTMRTGALVCPITIKTSASIEAWLRVTLIDIILTVAASETSQTQAGEGVNSIHTGSAIEARTVQRNQVKRFYCSHFCRSFNK